MSIQQPLSDPPAQQRLVKCQEKTLRTLWLYLHESFFLQGIHDNRGNSCRRNTEKNKVLWAHSKMRNNKVIVLAYRSKEYWVCFSLRYLIKHEKKKSMNVFNFFVNFGDSGHNFGDAFLITACNCWDVYLPILKIYHSPESIKEIKNKQKTPHTTPTHIIQL